MRGFGKRGRTYWTVLPLPEIRGRSVFDSRKDSLSETMADVFVFIVFKEILTERGERLAPGRGYETDWFCTHGFPGQSSPPLNSSLNVY